MTTIPASSTQKSRRRRRIERELRALHAMQSHLQTWEIVCAVLSIPALALLCFLVGWKLHVEIFALHVSIMLAIACGALIWLIGRRWFALASLIVLALLIVLCEDVADIPTGDDKPDRRTARRQKLEQAIAKREALLRSKGP
jgi:hypothetical protein